MLPPHTYPRPGCWSRERFPPRSRIERMKSRWSRSQPGLGAPHSAGIGPPIAAVRSFASRQALRLAWAPSRAPRGHRRRGSTRTAGAPREGACSGPFETPRPSSRRSRPSGRRPFCRPSASHASTASYVSSVEPVSRTRRLVVRTELVDDGLERPKQAPPVSRRDPDGERDLLLRLAFRHTLSVVARWPPTGRRATAPHPGRSHDRRGIPFAKGLLDSPAWMRTRAPPTAPRAGSSSPPGADRASAV